MWKLSATDIDKAASEPPSDTRAHVRSHAMRALNDKSLPYYLDWEVVGIGGGPSLYLENPLVADASPVGAWLESIETGVQSGEPSRHFDHE